ncbi:MAG: hypothetical protein GOU99_01095 [Candidatus Altiarchaeota archaeon]|nr:hypothetical protein [Candidatus Altiarchaeota archaeon]
MYAVKVKKELAQKRINQLKKQGFYDDSRRTISKNDSVIIPVVKRIAGSIKAELPETNRAQSVSDKFGISSFDIIGELAIIFIPDTKQARKTEIGQHIIKLYPRVKAVYAETGITSGKFRVQPLELIAGTGSETIHKENGLSFKLDITKVFFSPRQSTERMRLTKLVGSGDTVAVFFAGIGPIPIYLSKLTEVEKIYAIELNPDAYSYMLENIKLNKAYNIVAIRDDVKQVYSQLPECELAILPLPRGSLEYLSQARAVLKPDGQAIIYVAAREDELASKLKIIEQAGFLIKETRKELEIGPREWRFVVQAVKS